MFNVVAHVNLPMFSRRRKINRKVTKRQRIKGRENDKEEPELT